MSTQKQMIQEVPIDEIDFDAISLYNVKNNSPLTNEYEIDNNIDNNIDDPDFGDEEAKRVQFIYYQPLRVLFERDDETLSKQMKQLKEKLKIKMNNDETFNIDDYILDECCNGSRYRVLYEGE
mgnify:CR=1 FL=1